MELDPSKPIPPSLDKAICHVISIKMKQSTKLNNSPAINVSPSASATKRNPDSFEKNSIQSNEANYCNRMKQSTDIIKLIPGDSPDAFAAQTAAVAKSVDEEMRENIMNRVNSNTTIHANYYIIIILTSINQCYIICCESCECACMTFTLSLIFISS